MLIYLGYMHQLLVTVSHVRYGSDVYRLPIGLREIILINTYSVTHKTMEYEDTTIQLLCSIVH